MKTASQHSLAAAAVVRPKLGLMDQLIVSARGKRDTVLSTMNAMYLALLYLRSDVPFNVVTQLEGYEVANTFDGAPQGDETFLQGLYALEQAIMRERAIAANEALSVWEEKYQEAQALRAAQGQQQAQPRPGDTQRGS